MMSSLPKLAVTMLFIATAAAYTPTLRLPTPTIYSRTAIHAISMGGVSDRMANDGLLYDGWGAKGLETLNSTATLQQLAEDREISRYDAVLIVAARAKEKAYQSVDEEEGRGYIGSSFGGPMGAGARKPLPAKSQVVTRDWSLLFSPGRVDSLVRRPWPEYEPESSAAVGRRWTGCNLGRLYEHVAPSSSPVDSYSPSPSQSDLMGASFNTLSMSPSQQSMPMSPVAYRDF